MGKKKLPKKTKELSVAIAESSSITAEPQQQQTPRKRGRPRKIVEKIESEEIKEEQPQESEVAETESKKKAKRADGEEEVEEQAQIKEEAESAGKKEGGWTEKQPRSRARRKSKPRKSS